MDCVYMTLRLGDIYGFRLFSTQEPLALCGLHGSGIETTSFQVKSPGHTRITLSNLAIRKELLSPAASFLLEIPVPLKPDA